MAAEGLLMTIYSFDMKRVGIGWVRVDIFQEKLDSNVLILHDSFVVMVHLSPCGAVRDQAHRHPIGECWLDSRNSPTPHSNFGTIEFVSRNLPAG
jgi:hypothetical protein